MVRCGRCGGRNLEEDNCDGLQPISSLENSLGLKVLMPVSPPQTSIISKQEI